MTDTTKEDRFTKGPWDIRVNYFGRHEIFKDGAVIVRTDDWDPKYDEELKANARLIAQCPAMYNLLNEYVKENIGQDTLRRLATTLINKLKEPNNGN